MPLCPMAPHASVGSNIEKNPWTKTDQKDKEKSLKAKTFAIAKLEEWQLYMEIIEKSLIMLS